MKEIEIAARIKFLMKSTGITQRQLALRTGMDEATMSRIVNGLCNPTIKTIERIEDVLGENIIKVYE